MSSSTKTQTVLNEVHEHVRLKDGMNGAPFMTVLNDMSFKDNQGSFDLLLFDIEVSESGYKEVSTVSSVLVL